MNQTASGALRVGVAAIITNENGDILIAKSPKVNGWTMPGGHLNFGEKLQEALVREVFEETGLKVEVVKMINVCEVIKSVDFHMISFHFWCKANDVNQIILDGRELIDSKWVSPQEATELMALDDFKKSIEIFIKSKNANIYD